MKIVYYARKLVVFCALLTRILCRRFVSLTSVDTRYGYRGKDARNNLFVLASGEVVYFIAATVVIYHLDIHAQRFYLEHNDDV
jgi:hypothetical protein